jgi:1-acyl-sn-glycerol-3-phosphate acyltransferase
LSALAIARLAGAALLFCVIAPLHIAAKSLLGRSRWPSRFLKGAGWMFGLRTQVTGQLPGPHALLVANHSTWLDILVLGGSLGSAFVSKDELGHHFIHWLADQNGTVYVKRSHKKGAKDQAIALARALERDKPVTVFAEGTTGPGTHLLPFRSTLLEAVAYASRDVRVVPVALDYGDAREEVAWFEEPALNNIRRLLSRPGSLRVRVDVLDALDPSLDRKKLTNEAREAIAGRLGFKSHQHSPIGNLE